MQSCGRGSWDYSVVIVTTCGWFCQAAEHCVPSVLCTVCAAAGRTSQNKLLLYETLVVRVATTASTICSVLCNRGADELWFIQELKRADVILVCLHPMNLSPFTVAAKIFWVTTLMLKLMLMLKLARSFQEPGNRWGIELWLWHLQCLKLSWSLLATLHYLSHLVSMCLYIK